MREFKVSIGIISPFLVMGELIKADQNFFDLFDEKGALTSQGFREYIKEKARDCPFTEKKEFENYYSLKFVQISVMRCGQIKFKDEPFWSPKTFYYEITKFNKFHMVPLTYEMLFENLHRVSKSNLRGGISQFAFEIPDLKIFGFNDEFSHEKYWEISKALGRKIEIYTENKRKHQFSTHNYKRFGSFRTKNLKSSEPINLFCIEDEPDRIFVVFNVDGNASVYFVILLLSHKTKNLPLLKE
jgi:hypothetical protein